MKKCLFSIGIVLFLLGTTTGQITNIYVSAYTGNDSDDGTSWQTPYETIDKALDQLNGAAGTYNIYLSQGKYLLKDNNGFGGNNNNEYHLGANQIVNVLGGYSTPYDNSVAPVYNANLYSTAIFSENTANISSSFRLMNGTNASLKIKDVSILDIPQGNGLNGAFITLDRTTGGSFTMDNVIVSEWGGGDAGFAFIYDTTNSTITIQNSLIERSSNVQGNGQFVRANNGNRNVDILMESSIVRHIRGKGLSASIFYIDLDCEVDQGESSLIINESKFLNIKRGRAAAQAAAVITARRLPYLKLYKNIFQGNTGGNGGAVQFDESGQFDSELNLYQDNFGGQSAGAVWIRGDYPCANPAQAVQSEVMFKSDKFIANQAGIDGLSGRGGAIHIADDLLGNQITAKPVTISGSEFLENHTSAYDGGAIFANTSENLIIENSVFCDNHANKDFLSQVDGSGGAVYITGTGDLTVSNSTFINNSAEADGGAISSVTDGGVTIDECSYFSDNRAENNGGAIQADNYSGFNIDGSTFIGNFNEKNNGGAIDLSQNGVIATISNATFTGNITQGQGGAIWSNSDLVLDLVNFSSNYSQDQGGAIFAENDLDITNGNFTGNYSVTSSGGAIYVQASETLVFTDVNFTGNIAKDNGGGAIYVGSAVNAVTNQLSITRGYFQANLANGSNSNGGAIFSNSYGINTDDVVFLGNVASKDGGAIYLNVAGSQPMNLSNSKYIQNRTGEAGGAIHLFVDDDGTVKVNNNEFAENNAGIQGGAISVDDRDGNTSGNEIDQLNVNSFYGNTLGGTNASNTAKNQRSDIMIEFVGSRFVANIGQFNNNKLQFEANTTNYPNGGLNSGYRLGTGNTQQTTPLSVTANPIIVTVPICNPKECPIKEATPVSPIVLSVTENVNLGNPEDYSAYTQVNVLPNTSCIFNATEIAFSARSNNVPDDNNVIIDTPTPELLITYALTEVNLLTGDTVTTINSINGTNADRVEDPSDEILDGESGDLVRDLYKTYYLDVTNYIQPGYTYSYSITSVEVDNTTETLTFEYPQHQYKTDVVMDFCPCTIGAFHGITNIKSAQVGISTLDRNTLEWLPTDNEQGAYIVLESTEKGFVVPRYNNTADIANNIGVDGTNGIEEGMLVWDNQANCLKMFYDNTGDGINTWNCISSNSCINKVP